MYSVTLSLSLLLVVFGASRQDQPPLEAKERATGIAKQLRSAMTAPAIMKLDEGRKADSGLRGVRQREVGRPFMRQLVACGDAAKESLENLFDDADDSVRRSSVILLGQTRTDLEGKPLPNATLVNLHIPALENALANKDAQVRYFATDALGNLTNWSDDFLDRLKDSLPKIRELRKDADKDVRTIAWTATNNILAKLATGGKTPADRASAAKQLKQLKSEPRW